MTPKLDTYHEKRDFGITPEPKGDSTIFTGDLPIFVIQKHDATNLHYDFRLESEGVLKSWAVPKEIANGVGEKRLAVQTEDHPLEYADFEGEIPADQYGGGSVVLWDRGTWVPETDPEDGFRKGKLDFILNGDRLTGKWALVRMQPKAGKPADQKAWLLIKRPQVAKTTWKPPASLVDKVDPASIPGANKARWPSRVSPQLATLAEHPPEGDEWVHEPKLDGYRLICEIDRGEVTLLTRQDNDWTNRFPTIADQVVNLPVERAILDGEAVVYDKQGITSFHGLQQAIGKNEKSIVYVLFDLIYLDGYDLRQATLLDRKAALAKLLAYPPKSIRYGDHVVGKGEGFFRQVCEIGLEGIISKRADQPYSGERSHSWLKLKCLKRQEAVVIGYTEPQGSRTGFGSLVLAMRDPESGELKHVGRVGTGFDQHDLEEIHDQLSQIEQDESPVSGLTKREAGQGKEVTWVKPELVAEIEFGDWTDSGVLRHPSFKGLREDKSSSQVVQELAIDAKPKRKPKLPKLTNPDKVLFPDPGITKQQLADYWEAVAPFALPYYEGRPLSLYRCPGGYEDQCFFQKHVGVGMPDIVPRIDVGEGDPYAMVDSPGALKALVQLGTLEMHAWGSREPKLDQPDTIVFDLDPDEEVDWSEVVDAAFDVKKRLEDLGLVPFVKLTGGKGVHVVVPVKPGPEWGPVKQFTKSLVTMSAREEPDRFTDSISKSSRTGRIFIDYLRNNRGATAIAPFSPRARPGATVALPISWDDLEASRDKRPSFSVLEVPRMMKDWKDPWADYEQSRTSLVD